MPQEETEIVVVGTKGQIVIPQRLRKELAITPKTKLCVYRKDDKLVVAKLKFPPLAELWELLQGKWQTEENKNRTTKKHDSTKKKKNKRK